MKCRILHLCWRRSSVMTIVLVAKTNQKETHLQDLPSCWLCSSRSSEVCCKSMGKVSSSSFAVIQTWSGILCGMYIRMMHPVLCINHISQVYSFFFLLYGVYILQGIFTGPCGTQLNHAVLVVGYDSYSGVDFWIVKNSHGQSNNSTGYILMERLGSNNRHGLCGINMMPSYPIKTAHPPHVGGHQEPSWWASS